MSWWKGAADLQPASLKNQLSITKFILLASKSSAAILGVGELKIKSLNSSCKFQVQKSSWYPGSDLSLVWFTYLGLGLFLRTRFNDGHYVDGEAGIVNGKKYELTPNILENKNDYEFLQWDLEVGDCIYFDMRTLHGGLNSVTPKKDVHRYTLRMAKEDSKIIYRGDWAKEERAIMEENGYKNGDDLSGKMFPTLYKVD